MMSPHPRARRRLAAVGAGALCALAVGAAALPLSSASAAAPDNLSVFSAYSAASPYGVISRVPAETVGGALFSSTNLNLGKSQALAAGFTLGPLGDAFVVTSAPPGTITAMPTVITAQEPPSDTAPNEATFEGGRSGGGTDGEVRNFTLDAKANEVPSASARAAGNSVSSGLFSTGASTSSSDSDVAADGTVVTKALTTIHNIAVGAPGAQLTIAEATGLATITIAPGKKPVTVLQTQMHGAQLAGVPVVFDQDGLRIADQVALPASAIQSFNSAMASLAAQGITLMPAPHVENVTDEGAALSGGAFVYHYKLPDTFPRPSDIGSDQTFTVASVTATASSRVRSTTGPLVDGVAPAGATGGNVDTAAVPGIAPTTGTPALGVPTLGTGLPATAGAPVAGAQLFLPARVVDPLPKQFADSYRYVLLAAIAGVAAIVVLARARTSA